MALDGLARKEKLAEMETFYKRSWGAPRFFTLFNLFALLN